jgi:hypothetical protein
MLQYDVIPEGLEEYMGRQPVQQQVSKIIASFDGPFDVDDVIIAYKVRHKRVLPRGTAHMSLCRLAQAGKAEKVRRGVFKSLEESAACGTT